MVRTQFGGNTLHIEKIAKESGWCHLLATRLVSIISLFRIMKSDEAFLYHDCHIAGPGAFPVRPECSSEPGAADGSTTVAVPPVIAAQPSAPTPLLAFDSLEF